MKLRRALFMGFCLALLAIISPGCSDPYAGQMEITGNVTLEKQPLKDGSITFVPLDKQGTQSGAAITNGAYKVPRTTGLKPGKYQIQITSGDGKTPAAEEAGGPGSGNIVSVDFVPEDWNVRSKHEVDVKSTGPNKFDFDIPFKNTKQKKFGK